MLSSIFKPNSRVAFLGDSITAANNFTARIADYYITNMPERRVEFACAGVAGGTVSAGIAYLEQDLFPMKPDVVSIMYGINDAGIDFLHISDPMEREAKLDKAFQEYQQNMNRLVDILCNHGIEVILCTPVPYAEFDSTCQPPLRGCNALILRYADAVREMASAHKLALIDLHAHISELYLNESLYHDDHVHPNDRGHARMAECFLSAQGLPVAKFKIGEEPSSVSPNLAQWCTLTEKIRNIYAVEWMLIRNYSLPLEEKMKAVKDMIESNTLSPVLLRLALSFSEDKPYEADIVAKINDIMSHMYA